MVGGLIVKEGLFDFYSGVAGNLARRLCVFGRVDVLANDRDDYKSIFQLESLGLQSRFRELHGFNVDAEYRYVRKGLYKYCWRIGQVRRQRYKEMSSYESVLFVNVPPASTEKLELEYRIEAKQAVKQLEKSLSKEDMKLLWRYALLDGRVEANFQPGMTKKQAKYRIGLLRTEAKKILKK